MSSTPPFPTTGAAGAATAPGAVPDPALLSQAETARAPKEPPRLPKGAFPTSARDQVATASEDPRINQVDAARNESLNQVEVWIVRMSVLIANLTPYVSLARQVGPSAPAVALSAPRASNLASLDQVEAITVPQGPSPLSGEATSAPTRDPVASSSHLNQVEEGAPNAFPNQVEVTLFDSVAGHEYTLSTPRAAQVGRAAAVAAISGRAPAPTARAREQRPATGTAPQGSPPPDVGGDSVSLAGLEDPILSFAAPVAPATAPIVLVVVLAPPGSQPLFLAHAAMALPGSGGDGSKAVSAGARREGAVTRGTRLAQSLLPAAEYSPWLAAELRDSPFGAPLDVVVLPINHPKQAQAAVDSLRARVVHTADAMAGLKVDRGGSWVACTWKAVSDSPIATACAVALMSVESLLRRSRPDPEPPPASGAAASTGQDRWRLLGRIHTAVQRKVRAALVSAGGNIADYVDRVTDGSWANIPTALRGHDPDALDHRWRTERFSPVLRPPATSPLPPIVPQRQTKFRPSSPCELLLPAAFDKLVAWLRGNAADVADMAREVDGAPRPNKQKPLVLGQGDFVPDARGIVWDLRRAAEGIIVPLDFEAAPAHDLNVGQLVELLHDCPDKELLDHLRRGVDFKAELPLQAVLLPHMVSLGPHAPLVEKELERLVQCGWHRLFHGIPFLPLRLNPNGAVIRKLEQHRPRRVENASADGNKGGVPLRDADGVVVRSLNHAVGIQDTGDEFAGDVQHLEGEDAPPAQPNAPRKWPKEVKPAVLDNVHDLGVLRYAARVFREDLVGFVVDFKDYFNNFPVSSKYLWMNICHWRTLLGIGGEDLGCFVSELRLGFGVSAASNVCQRFAHALAEIFREAFDREEEALFHTETDTARREYLQARRSLGPGQCRLYELAIYTDDPFFACAGVDRLTRALRLWHKIMDIAGLALAVPAKRQCGAELCWLGVEFVLTAGVHFVPHNKRLRALREVSRIVEGCEAITFSDYRSVTSFLQYLRPLVLHLDGAVMYHIYGPHRRSRGGRLPQPADIVVPGAEAIASLARWVDVLGSACGAFFSGTLSRRPPPGGGADLIFLFSDAALELPASPREPDQSGLGGYCEGLYWSLPISGIARRLPITVLEFIAIGINCIVFAALVRGFTPVVCSDSLSSVSVLNNFTAHGELMQFTHQRLLEIPECSVATAGGGSTKHCFGPSNPCADAASRGQFSRLALICSHLNIAPERLEVPPAGRELLGAVCAFANSKSLLTDGPRRRLHATALELKAAAQSGNGFGHEGTVERARPDLLAERTRLFLREVQRPMQGRAPQPPARPHISADRRYRTVHGPDRPAQLTQEAYVSNPRALPGTSHGSHRRGVPCDFAATTAALPRAGPALNFAAYRRAGGAGSDEASTPFVSDTRFGKRPALAASTSGSTGSEHGKAKLPRLSEGQLRISAAAETRLAEMVAHLTADVSPLALRPSREGALEALCAAHIAVTSQAHAISTTDKDATAWRRWESYCSSMGTPALRSVGGRSAFADAAAGDRETVLQSGFLIYLASIVEPRSKAAPAAKPQSFFNNLLAVRRVHQRLGVDFRVAKGASLTLTAQVRQYVIDNGPEALIPARKEPLDAPRLRRILALRDGVRIGNRTLDWSSHFFRSFKALLCTGLAAAFRKAELCLPDGASFAMGQLSVDSVSWVFSGVATARASREQLRSLRSGDFCVITPPICKNDPFALHFGSKPIWLPFSDDPVNAAQAIAAMFIAEPGEHAEPARTPLFRADASGTAFKHSVADAVFRDLITAAFPGADCSRWSLHSLRIGAASALLAAKASHPLIQAICRWRSAKSVDIYARLGPSDYAQSVLEIEKQTVDAVTAQRVRELRMDYDDIIAALEGPQPPGGDEA